VIFSAPLGDETDVPVTVRVRVQFSRDMRARTFENRVHIRYSGPNAPAAPPATAAIAYDDGTRSLEIRFKEPLERFQTVTIELGEGIAAIDGQVLKPWTLTFSTGG
jgi:hypothetical protein